jgi:large subunit ribosomal protein L6
MSRVAKNPVVIPAGVEVKIDAGQIVVKGPLGSQAVHPSVKVEHGEAGVQCSAIEGAVNGNAMSGTLRALVNNMVTGVSKGFERKLNLVGVGYRAQAQGDKLNLSLGFSHPVVHQMPVGIKVRRRLRRKSLSRVSTSRLSARLLLKSVRIARRSPTRARASVTRTKWLP